MEREISSLRKWGSKREGGGRDAGGFIGKLKTGKVQDGWQAMLIPKYIHNENNNIGM